MMARSRVVVVSHEATRTGAPRVALEVVGALKDDTTEVIGVLRRPAALVRAFEDAADDVVMEPRRRSRALLRRLRGARRTADRFEQQVARRLLRRLRPDLVYLNTVKSACYVRPALELGLPVVVHVHEPRADAKATLSRYRLGPLLPRVVLVACSPPVRAGLTADFSLPGDAVAYVPSPVNPDEVEALAAAPGPPAPAHGATVVGTCGTADRRKGVDLWLQMVAELRRGPVDPQARFVWVGRVRDRHALQLARELRVDDVVDFVGELANPHPIVADMSVFTLSSREDPFPVAVLEAMALARPVVAFAVGGLPEQLGDAGMLVPTGDVRAMAEGVRTLLADEHVRRELGSRASARVRTRFDTRAFRATVREIVDAHLPARNQAADGK